MVINLKNNIRLEIIESRKSNLLGKTCAKKSSRSVPSINSTGEAPSGWREHGFCVIFMFHSLAVHKSIGFSWGALPSLYPKCSSVRIMHVHHGSDLSTAC